ncbi:MAG: RNA polymerase sigma factor [Acholeplasmataceae bacterium]|nr:RNA polymerase sigma factor [Acholeplasmataceae bacterium]
MVDRKTIEALKQKSELAFESVYDQTKRGVYAMIYSIVRNHQVTEDIMQDVYMKMMTSLETYKMGTNFYNWLITMAKHQAIDHYRRQKKTTTMELADYDQLNSSPDPTPDQLSTFEMMMGALNDDQRQVVLLRVVDEMTFKNISKTLEKPIGTVLWLYREAMKAMKGVEV